MPTAPGNNTAPSSSSPPAAVSGDPRMAERMSRTRTRFAPSPGSMPNEMGQSSAREASTSRRHAEHALPLPSSISMRRAIAERGDRRIRGDRDDVLIAWLGAPGRRQRDEPNQRCAGLHGEPALAGYAHRKPTSRCPGLSPVTRKASIPSFSPAVHAPPRFTCATI